MYTVYKNIHQAIKDMQIIADENSAALQKVQGGSDEYFRLHKRKEDIYELLRALCEAEKIAGRITEA